MNEYVPLLGILLQYARSQKLKDYWVALVVVTGCIGVWWLEGGSLVTREAWGLRGILGLVLMTLGVAQTTSMAANVGVKLGLNPEHGLVPVTNNK